MYVFSMGSVCCARLRICIVLQYLQYKNVRPDYLKEIWKVVNWNNVSDRLKHASS